MQIVIDVPEKLVCEGFERPFTEEEKNILIKAIGNGTPLPRNHGRLIDADWVLNKMTNADADTLPRTQYEYYAWNFAQSLLIQAPIVIEAEGGD